MRSLILLIGSSTLSTALCLAQMTPVVAKQRTVADELDESGKVVRHWETQGMYLRNSKGAVLTQRYSTLGGEPVLQSGQLLDFDAQRAYTLDYQRREAMARWALPKGSRPDYLRSASDSLGEETVNGIHCVIGRVTEVTKDGARFPIGRTWVSREYSLSVKRDVTIEPPGGPRTHEVTELYDISFVEPNPDEFALEKNFSLLEKKSPDSCKKSNASLAVPEPPK